MPQIGPRQLVPWDATRFLEALDARQMTVYALAKRLGARGQTTFKKLKHAGPGRTVQRALRDRIAKVLDVPAAWLSGAPGYEAVWQNSYIMNDGKPVSAPISMWFVQRAGFWKLITKLTTRKAALDACSNTGVDFVNWVTTRAPYGGRYVVVPSVPDWPVTLGP